MSETNKAGPRADWLEQNERAASGRRRLAARRRDAQVYVVRGAAYGIGSGAIGLLSGGPSTTSDPCA